MGILSDFVVADSNAGPDIGNSQRPSEQWPCLEGWKGVETIKLSTLHFCINGKMGSVDETVSFSSDFELVGGNHEEGPWVLRFPMSALSSIAAVPPSDVATVAERWCSTEELQMDGWTQDDARTFINQLQPLAANALASGKCMYLWLSL
jgi:hypothetical protein